MPQRKYLKQERFDTEEIQGEGSFVVMARPTFEDLELALEGVTDLTKADEIELSKKLLDKLVVQWNWVDDDGDPLPQPSDEVIKGLPMQETLYLVNLVKVDGLVDQKKSEGK